MSKESLSLYREIAAELTAPGAPFALSQPGRAATRRMAGTRAGLFDVIDNAVTLHADKPLFEFDGIAARYDEVMADAERLGAALREQHGIGKGDVVGIVMQNSPQWFVAFFAVQRVGAVAALLNSRAKGPDIAATAGDVGCLVILADRRCAARLAGETDIKVIPPEALDALIAAGGANSASTPGEGDDPAAILFTSGTTGRPKGATISHSNLACMTRQFEYTALLNQSIAARRLGIPVDHISKGAPRPAPLLVVPMFHISGIVTMLMTMLGGGLLVGMRRWEPAVALDLIERHRVTQVTGPSLMMADLLAEPNGAERLQSVKSFIVAGQASPIGLTDRIRRAVPGATQSAGWGMTESCGSVASAAGGVFDNYPGTVGFPLPLADIVIRGPDGQPVAQGEVGEVAVRGPTVMLGYWGRPDATRETFDDEWLLTGDLGRFDENGLLSIVDRAKDMVISAGENIYCAEVEQMLAMVAHHHEVALFGVPDERLGERAVAAIVFAEDYEGSPDAEAVRAHVASMLADYKVPTEIVFDLGPLPRNVTGKVDKAELRRRYEQRTTA